MIQLALNPLQSHAEQRKATLRRITMELEEADEIVRLAVESFA